MMGFEVWEGGKSKVKRVGRCRLPYLDTARFISVNTGNLYGFISEIRNPEGMEQFSRISTEYLIYLAQPLLPSCDRARTSLPGDFSKSLLFTPRLLLSYSLSLSKAILCLKQTRAEMVSCSETRPRTRICPSRF